MSQEKPQESTTQKKPPKVLIHDDRDGWYDMVGEPYLDRGDFPKKNSWGECEVSWRYKLSPNIVLNDSLFHVFIDGIKDCMRFTYQASESFYGGYQVEFTDKTTDKINFFFTLCPSSSLLINGKEEVEINTENEIAFSDLDRILGASCHSRADESTFHTTHNTFLLLKDPDDELPDTHSFPNIDLRVKRRRHTTDNGIAATNK